MKYLLAPVIFAFLAASPALAQDEEDAGSTPAAETPAAEATPASADSDKKPVNMFEELDYDEELDVFNAPGTKTPYTGPVYSVYDNGTKEAEGYLKDGHEEGWWIDYNENGSKSDEGVYKAGNEDGWWSYFHENGAFESGGVFENGVPVGKWVAFFENGKPDFEGQYVDGLMDGDWIFHDEETGAKRVIKFDKGTQLNE